MAELAIDEKLMEQVKALARRRSVPVERQAEELLADAISQRRRIEELRTLVDRIAALTPVDVPQTDSVQILQEDRGDRRRRFRGVKVVNPGTGTWVGAASLAFAAGRVRGVTDAPVANRSRVRCGSR